MKKHLLLFLAVVLSISAFAADVHPNPYAYGISATWTSDFDLVIIWSTQAPATAMNIVAKDSDGDHVLCEYGSAAKGVHTATINMLDAVSKGLNTNEDFELRIDVYGRDRETHELVGQKTSFRSPFSIDIDNHPFSSNFGCVYATQLMWYDTNGDGKNDYPRGVWKYDQWMTLLGAWMGNGLEAATGTSWFGGTHGVPHMVRVVQDGTGRLLVSSSDRDQTTHLWLIDDLNHMTSWKEVLNSSSFREWTKVGDVKHTENVNFANIGLDIRENGENLDLLLYHATVGNSNHYKITTNHGAGSVYSGIYTVPKTTTDFKNGEYTSYTAATYGKSSNGKNDFISHPIVSNEYTGSMFTANANFDKYGGVLYNAYSLSVDENKSALIHRNIKGEFKSNYADNDTYLKRKSVATKGLRFNHNFSKVAIAQGTQGSEIRFYDVNQSSETSHPTFTNGISVDMVTSRTGATNEENAYVHDIAWDYASNVYATVRNQGGMYGIYMLATDLDGTVVSTPIKGTFRVNCPDEMYTVNVGVNLPEAGSVTGGGKQAACTEMTVTATPKNAEYRFIAWMNGTDTVSKNSTYTFRVTKNMTLTAHFVGAVFNVTWWNLFQDGEDIYNESTDGTRNTRLYRLFQGQYNTQFTPHHDGGEASGKYQVMYFVHTASRTNSNETKETILSNTETFVDATSGRFYWLGQYIESLVNKDINNVASSGGTVQYIWAYYLQAFFNRTGIENADFASANIAAASISNGVYSNYDFTEQGKALYWRPWWTDIACNLPNTLNYTNDMPVSWNMIPGPAKKKIQIWTTAGFKTVVPETEWDWYKWNTGGANQLLAWREGSTSGRIVHHVDKPDMKLYATYVDKHISDSEDNTDVIRLMQNPGYDGKYHTVTVDRKLQAGMYNTICLPFSVNLNSLDSEHPLYGADVRKLTGKTEELYDSSGESVIVLNFEKVTQMEAGKPYIIKLNGSGNVTDPMIFENVEYNDLTIDGVNEEVSENFSTVTFHAIMKPTEVPEGALILVAENRLAIATGGEMKGLRGYFVIDDPYLQEAAEDGRVYMSMNKPTTTSIPVAPEAEQQTKPQVRKIMRDGKIYILRGEEIYTITGHRVK